MMNMNFGFLKRKGVRISLIIISVICIFVALDRFSFVYRIQLAPLAPKDTVVSVERLDEDIDIILELYGLKKDRADLLKEKQDGYTIYINADPIFFGSHRSYTEIETLMEIWLYVTQHQFDYNINGITYYFRAPSELFQLLDSMRIDMTKTEFLSLYHEVYDDDLKHHQLVKKLADTYVVKSGYTRKPGHIQVVKKENHNETPQVMIPENELIYKNEKAGYQIAFPENWRGYYVITEYSPGEVCIGFYGESKTSQIACKHSLGRDGLDMAWVVDEKPAEGSLILYELGEVDGVEYFLTTPRGGAYLPDLEAISNPDSTARELAKYEVDETELDLAEKDLEKAIQMRDDLYYRNISFSPINQ